MKEDLTIFTGIDKMSLEDLKLQVAIMETFNCGTLTVEYIDSFKNRVQGITSKLFKSSKNRSKIAPNINNKRTAFTLSDSMSNELQKAIERYTGASREFLMERLLHNIRLRTGYDRTITDRMLISKAVVDKAYKYLKIDRNLSNNLNEMPHREKIEAVYRRYFERLAQKGGDLFNDLTEEQIQQFEKAVDEGISAMSANDKKYMQEALNINALTGEAVRKALTNSGFTAGIMVLMGQFGTYMAVTSIMHALFTIGLGITLPFGIYTGMSTFMGILGGPLAIIGLLGFTIYNMNNGSSKLDGELLSQLIFFSRATHGRSFSTYSLDNILEGMLEKSRKRIVELEENLDRIVVSEKNSVILDTSSYITKKEAKKLIDGRIDTLNRQFAEQREKYIKHAQNEMQKHDEKLQRKYLEELTEIRRNFKDKYTNKVRECNEARAALEKLKKGRANAEAQMEKSFYGEMHLMEEKYKAAITSIKDDFARKEEMYEIELHSRDKALMLIRKDLNNSLKEIDLWKNKHNDMITELSKIVDVEFDCENAERQLLSAIDNALNPVFNSLVINQEEQIEQIKHKLRNRYTRFGEDIIERMAVSELLIKILCSADKDDTGISINSAISNALLPEVAITEGVLKKIFIRTYGTVDKRKWTLGSMARRISKDAQNWRMNFSKNLDIIVDNRNNLAHGSIIKTENARLVLGILFDVPEPGYDMLLYLNKFLEQYDMNVTLCFIE